MRLRKAQGKLKIEHSIIDGVRDLLEDLLASNPEIRSVIPGVIRPVRDAKGEIKVHVTVPTKRLEGDRLKRRRKAGAFISTALSKGGSGEMPADGGTAPINSTLELTPEQMRAYGYRVVDQIVRHLATLGAQPVGHKATPAQALGTTQ